jgi:hypothetical protein
LQGRTIVIDAPARIAVISLEIKRFVKLVHHSFPQARGYPKIGNGTIAFQPEKLLLLF